ncbi:uncharacterized protein N7459_004588 [Penicillium hispanicum]|uniref:uncharacterized protein n=1 Tax=Penicillium hispanicum TaxID=1080232 RepID=UPI0025413E57|nr:uncharacterized protein N7459_004588 [Penicillium hispanicum]KAJ5584788.1 hypothetical protein N7459_004588 [Penicillium hispanicum]
MVGSYALHKELHDLPPKREEMVKLLTVDLDLPLGVVAPYRPNHPIIQSIPPTTLAQSSFDGTLSILVNGGPLQEELSRLAANENLAILGSSANLTGTGAKSLIEEIETEVREAADIIIDYGRQKFNSPRSSSTMIDFQNLELIRYGACYDVLQDALWRYYRIRFPLQDPIPG